MFDENREEKYIDNVLLLKLNMGETTFSLDEVSGYGNFRAKIKELEKDCIVWKTGDREYAIIVDIGELRKYVVQHGTVIGGYEQCPKKGAEYDITLDKIVETFWKIQETNGDTDKDSGGEEREQYIEARRQTLLERLSKMDNVDNATNNEEEDKERIKEIERRRRALMERLRRMNEKDDSADADEEHVQDNQTLDLRESLIKCLERGLQDKSDSDKFILDLEGSPEFELKFVNDGKSLKISDGGKTLTQVSQTKRKINNVLKEFVPVKLEGNEISITIENPFGTLKALLTLYSAIDAVKKMKR